jgi:hypothetical protein
MASYLSSKNKGRGIGNTPKKKKREGKNNPVDGFRQFSR